MYFVLGVFALVDSLNDVGRCRLGLSTIGSGFICNFRGRVLLRPAIVRLVTEALK